MPENVDKEVWKEAVKEALSEWLDKKFTQFGKWTFNSLLAAAFSGAVYLALKGQGWNK